MIDRRPTRPPAADGPDTPDRPSGARPPGSRTFPILEFDGAAEAVIEPGRQIGPADVPEQCVVCFFRDVIEDLRGNGAREIAIEKSQTGDHPVYETEILGRRVAVFHPGVGAPIAAALLEHAIALGCTKFVAIGGAGVLDSSIPVGHLVVPHVALRDEGTSYHYLPPAREVSASPGALAAIERTLRARGHEYTLGKTWTTDGFYRETRSKVRMRRAEGCLTVEMEAAALFAVARFRGVEFGQILYAGDDVSGTDWDHRSWTRHAIRERMFELAATACLDI